MPIPKWIVVALALAAPVQGYAQHGAIADAGVVMQCFSNTPTGETKPACVGDAAELCEYTPPRHQTTLDIMDCRLAEASVWNGLLDDWHSRYLESFEAEDQRNKDKPGYINTSDAFEQVHQKWVEYRDAECRLVYIVKQAGSMKNILSPLCSLQMTAERVLQMRDGVWFAKGTDDQ